MVERHSPALSLSRQCTLLGLSRSSLYYEPALPDVATLQLLRLIDQQYLRTPYYGSRRMMAWLRSQGHAVGRDRVRRLMRTLGLEAIYQKPRTSRPNPEHRVYPYLLRDLPIDRPGQVWCADVCYIPMGAVGRVVGIWGWRNLRLVQPARAGVVAPAEITP